MENKAVNTKRRNGTSVSYLFPIGIYSVFIGLFYIFILSIEYSHHSRPGLPILFIVIVTISWLVIGGFIFLFKKQQSGVMVISLLVAQIIIEILSLPSYGFLFLIGTLLLTIFLWLYSHILKKASKTILILISLIIIGAGSAFMIMQLGITKSDDQIKNVVITNQTGEENVTFKNNAPEYLNLPVDKEKQAIDIAINDPKVKEILAGKEYNVTKVQRIGIATMNQTTLSENNVIVEIETGNITYFINVDLLKKIVQGNIVPIPKIS